MTTTAELLAEARKLDAEATPGPWHIEMQGSCLRGVGVDSEDRSVVAVCCQNCLGGDPRLRAEDAAFIARARTLLTQLADAYMALHARIRGWAIVPMNGRDNRPDPEYLWCLLDRARDHSRGIARFWRPGEPEDHAPDCPARPMEDA